MGYLEAVKMVIANAQHLGSIILPNGTALVGSTPHIAPEAWLHKIFIGLSSADVDVLEADLRKKMPLAYRSFLTNMNGASFFSDSLALEGFRQSYARLNGSVWQPFDLLISNTLERLKDAKESLFFIGSYNSDGSLLYIDGDDNFVYRCGRESSSPLNQWPDFSAMLESELFRLSELFDREGRKLDPSVPTHPKND